MSRLWVVCRFKDTYIVKFDRAQHLPAPNSSIDPCTSLSEVTPQVRSQRFCIEFQLAPTMSSMPSKSPLLPAVLSHPGSNRFHVVLPSDFKLVDRHELHSQAICHLRNTSSLDPNMSMVIDYAYLGPITHGNDTSAAVLTYHDQGERSYHGAKCTHMSCLGYDYKSEAAEHDGPPDDLLFYSPGDPYMCRDNETWNTEVVKQWERDKAFYQLYQSDHRVAKAKIIYPKDDPIAEWAQDNYKLKDCGPEVYVRNLNKRRQTDPSLLDTKQYYSGSASRYRGNGSHYSKGYGEDAQIEVASSSSSGQKGGSDRSTKYYAAPSVVKAVEDVVDNSVKGQHVGLGHLLVRRMITKQLEDDQARGGKRARDSDNELGDEQEETDSQEHDGRTSIDPYIKHGKYYHDCSEANPLCPGFATEDLCRSRASIVPEGDEGRILNARCHDGQAHEFEEDFLLALGHKFLDEVDNNPDLKFEDSETARLTDLFPRLTVLFIETDRKAKSELRRQETATSVQETVDQEEQQEIDGPREAGGLPVCQNTESTATTLPTRQSTVASMG